ncbi:hypothetical protein CDAR_76491 [Caerostris darwini]|uniref:Uncharacterized protein n=1 Tax=Caerostris darwini TaxID=1538125 RepID=A0AAV4QFE0_9ARAC|nr:hypothetical protein CDAR_76491 [Caerostris darwini]
MLSPRAEPYSIPLPFPHLYIPLEGRGGGSRFRDSSGGRPLEGGREEGRWKAARKLSGKCEGRASRFMVLFHPHPLSPSLVAGEVFISESFKSLKRDGAGVESDISCPECCDLAITRNGFGEDGTIAGEVMDGGVLLSFFIIKSDTGGKKKFFGKFCSITK